MSFELDLNLLIDTADSWSYVGFLMNKVYDVTLGNQLNLHIPDFQEYWKDWQDEKLDLANNTSLTEELLCMGTAARGFLDEYNQTATSLCRIPSMDPYVPFKRDTKGLPQPVIPRTLYDSDITNPHSGIDQDPSWGESTSSLLVRSSFFFVFIIPLYNSTV